MSNNYRSGRRFRRPPEVVDLGREFRPPSAATLWRVGVVIVLALLVLLGGLGLRFYTDWAWFNSLGLSAVFFTPIWARVAIFLIAFALAFVFFVVNIVVARALTPRGTASSAPARFLGWLSGPVTGLLLLGGAVVSVLLALEVQDQWELFLRYRNAVPFGARDPIFNQDVGFYVFTLPVYQFVRTWLLELVIVALLGAVATYALGLGRLQLTPAVKGHLSGLGAIILVLIAWTYRLNIYELVYSPRGVVVGASYTDVHAQWPAFTLLIIISLLCAALLLANVFLRALRAIALIVGLWVVISLLAGGVYPTLVQNLQVKPSELVKEKPYIEYNIALTRQAYGLDRIQEIAYPAEDMPSAQDIARNTDTMANIRLWDYRPLLQTYDQIQTIRTYYDFLDVDIDRYTLGGTYRQVMLSARELAPEKLAAQAQTWINQKLIYTHGYGATMSPVNEVTADGSPNLLIKDLPPVGEPQITRPEIYYGEKSDGYVIVKTKTLEFDYPKGDQNAFTTYQGSSGVSIGSYLSRLIFALRFGDFNIMLTDAITPESRILYVRNIHERVRAIAPFLQYDHDPYLVIADGRLWWIQDAYTTSDRYPYSEPYRNTFNYIRNSVKIVINAYDGSLTFYVADAEEPILRAYRGIFPTLFQSLDEMPASLRPHLRYPEDLFLVQAEMYRAYHMQDAQVFYNKEDLWETPKEVFAGREQPMEPYYVIMRLPGGTRESFMLILPFVPANRQNMVAWMAAQCDGEDYGKMVAYRFPKEKLIYGPMQIAARIDQDPVISSQLTLWSQRGSSVIRGNLLVIPIEKSLLYVEPLYLLAERGQIPQLKRVIVAAGPNIAMEETLDAALAKVFGTAPVVATPTTPTTPTTPLPTDVAALVRSANDHYEKAQAALRAGDWTTYGAELKALQQDLQRLLEVTR